MIRVDREDEGRIEIWTIDRPQASNALDDATAAQLQTLVSNVPETVRGIVIAASPPPEGKRSVFLAGADLRQVQAIPDEATARAFAHAMMQTLAKLEEIPALVVAAIAGDCFGGGCEFVTACDLRIAEEGVQFVFRQTRMGLASGWGGTTRLSRLVSLGAAKKLLLTGLPCEANEAHRVGLVDEIVPKGAAKARALEIVRAASEGSPHAIAAMKRGLLESRDVPRDVSYARELDRFVESWRGADHKEALAALREKRPPKFW